MEILNLNIYKLGAKGELLRFIDLVLVFLFLVVGFFLLVVKASLVPRVGPFLGGVPGGFALAFSFTLRVGIPG